MASDLVQLPTITTTALDLRIQIDVSLLRLGLTWKSDPIRRWMQHAAAVTGHAVTSPADLPDEALLALLRNLDAKAQKINQCSEVV